MGEEKKHALKEIEQAKSEVSATVVLDKPSHAGSISSLIGSLAKLKVILSLALLLGIVSVLVFAVSNISSWITGSTFKQSSASVVESIRDLSTLATAEAHIKVVKEETDNKIFGMDIGINLPGTQRKVLLIVPATVVAGVDLKQIDSSNLLINEEEKTIQMILPKATFVQEPAIIMEKVQAFSNEGLLRDEVSWEEGFALAAEAQELVKQEAIDAGLLITAERNAEKVLSEFFSKLGYTTSITFK